jgi:hypothetical protein
VNRIPCLLATALLLLPGAVLAQERAIPQAHQGGQSKIIDGDGNVKSAVTSRKAAADDASALSMPVAIFVDAKASGFGMYEPRGSNVFRPGEKLRFYVEPQGYQYSTEGKTVVFGVVMDLKLITPQGDVLFRKDGFLDQSFASHHENKELMLNGDLDITGADAGSYLIVLTLHDKMSSNVATTKLPFTIR